MYAGKTSKKDVVIQDNNITHSVVGMESASSVCDDDSLYPKKLEHPDRISDFFYRESLVVASQSACSHYWG
jgi:hypothetical protein